MFVIGWRSSGVYAVFFEFGQNCRRFFLWNSKDWQIQYTFIFLQNLFTNQRLNDSREYKRKHSGCR